MAERLLGPYWEAGPARQWRLMTSEARGRRNHPSGGGWGYN